MVKDNQNRTSTHKKKSTTILVTAIVIGLLVCVAIPTAVYMHFSNTPDTTDTSSSSKKVESSTKDSESDTAMTDSNGSLESTETTEEEMGLEEYNDKSNAEDVNEQSTDMSDSSMSQVNDLNASSEDSMSSDANDSGNTYTVQAKDNLYRIALNHGMTQQELMDLNGLTSTEVSVGQVLKVK